MAKETPLVPDPEGKPYSAEVIDLADVRIEWGRTPPQEKKCEHKRLVYSRDERRVWCSDCERTVEGFDAFMTVVRSFNAMEADARRKQEKAAEALASTVVRRSAKEIDRTWMSKMAICCPHCRTGLLPEDFERGVSCVSGELERARRARKAKDQP